LLNEIGELDLSLQAKLLTFFDTRSFLRVGGENPVTVNARIVAATNRDLNAEVEQGAFRRDLYYRLNVFAIDLPPLRERAADIPVLAREILGQLKRELGLGERPRIEQTALDSLMCFSWPGNIRELRNVLERALIASRGGTIQVKHLKLLSEEREWAFNVTFSNDLNLHEVTKDLTRQLINEALRRAGTKTGAARLLGISRDSFNYQLKSLKLDEPK
jgi:DNA-binding NtrC family response regulator